jgi:hypothetical protein
MRIFCFMNERRRMLTLSRIVRVEEPHRERECKRDPESQSR